MKFSIIILLNLILLSSFAWAQESASLSAALKNEKTFEEKEQSLINYSNIKKTLRNDGLTNQKKKRVKLIKQITIERKSINLEKYNYPSDDEFWMFMSELWLVKNAQLLAWDVPKPDYGIEKAFKGLLEKLGYYNKKFKILIVNSPNIVHFGLPSRKDEYIFILSLPFMRSLDLTKVDLSLILLEDFFRLENRDFINNLDVDTNFLGTNFYQKEYKTNMISNILKKYSEIIFKKGFVFKQQYEVTKTMDRVLKTSPAIWSAYFRMLTKIDRYTKSDLLYKNYIKIYPSPELQIQWLSPKKKVI
jgi:hypothetical protein